MLLDFMGKCKCGEDPTFTEIRIFNNDSSAKRIHNVTCINSSHFMKVQFFFIHTYGYIWHVGCLFL